jgi:ketosteroid isomerase-like protein
LTYTGRSFGGSDAFHRIAATQQADENIAIAFSQAQLHDTFKAPPEADLRAKKRRISSLHDFPEVERRNRVREEQDPSYVHRKYLKAFTARDIDATVECYESQARFVSNSDRSARSDAELREVYRAIFSDNLRMKFYIRKVIPAGGNLALVILDWTSKAFSATGEAKLSFGTAIDIVRRQRDGTWRLVLDSSSGFE